MARHPAVRKKAAAARRSPTRKRTATTEVLDAPPQRDVGPISKAPPATLMTVGLDLIDEDVPNHRAQLDGERLAELRRSMERDGLQQPIRLAGKDGGRYTMIFGHRRLAAAVELGWASIPALVSPPMPAATIRQLQAIENLMREDLTPIEESLMVCGLLEAVQEEAREQPLPDGVSAADRVAAMIGRSESWVRKRSQLVRLSPRCRELLAGGAITIRHAEQLAKLADHERQDDIAAGIAWDEPGTHCLVSTKDIRDAVAGEMQSLERVPWKLDVEVGEQPPCIGCPHNTDEAHGLFADLDEAKDRPPAQCLNPACYAKKAQLTARMTEVAANKLRKTDRARTPKQAADFTPAFVEPARVARLAKKLDEGAKPAKKKTVSRGPRHPGNPENAAKQKAAASRRKQLEAFDRQLQARVQQDEGVAAAMLIVQKLEEWRDAAQADGYNRARNSAKKREGLRRQLLPLVKRAFEGTDEAIAALADRWAVQAIRHAKRNRWGAVLDMRTSGWGEETTLLSALSEATGIELPPARPWEDFLPKPKASSTKKTAKKAAASSRKGKKKPARTSRAKPARKSSTKKKRGKKKAARKRGAAAVRVVEG